MVFANRAPKLHFSADSLNNHDDRIIALRSRYGTYTFDEADVIVVLGGDGSMLHMLHRTLGLDKPVFGLNFGTVGFLMNAMENNALIKRIVQSHAVTINPLKMTTSTEVSGVSLPKVHYALNEVSLLREGHQAAKICIHIDGQIQLSEIICDGILVATPMGSTAYNFSASGPILPITSNLLALTPISPFRPRRWRGALLPETVEIFCQILEPEKRPTSASADFQEVRGIHEVTIKQDKSRTATLLYDSHQTLADRVITEQFAT